MIECAAGRNIQNPDRLGWGEPCPQEGTLVLIMTDGNEARGYYLCPEHMADLERAGIVHDPNKN